MISLFDVTILFIALYPIIPTYFLIGGISFCLILELGYPLLVMFASRGRISRFGSDLRMTAICLILFSLSTGLSSIMNSEIVPLIRFLFSVPIMGLVIITEVNTEERLNRCIDVIVNVACVISILGIIESITGFNIFTLLNTANSVLNEQMRLGLLRAKSFTYQSNSYGSYLMLVSALCIYRMNSNNTRFQSKKWSIKYFLICTAVVFTISRGSIILFLLCQILIWSKIGVAKLVKKLIILMIIILVGYYISTMLLTQFSDLLSNLLYTVLSVFDDSLVDNISGSNTGVASAEGHRLLLYSWVWESIKNNLWFGMGSQATLNYRYYVGNASYGYYAIKNSIEVEILNCMYRYGIICMISKVIFYLSILKTALLGRRKKDGLQKLSFDICCGISFLVYYITLFSVAQDTESRIFYLIVFLFFASKKIRRDYNTLPENNLERITL